MDIPEPLPALRGESPAAYFHVIDMRSLTRSQRLLPVWDRDIVKVGRDPKTNSFAIDDDTDFMVSRNHCEFYVVVYEPTVNHVYVRDRKSSNGTYVNGNLVGAGPRMSPGHLLQHADVVEIRPHWKFVFHQRDSPPRYDLTHLQIEECKLFHEKYSLTDRCLGQGAEAVVYLATETLTKNQLVCKLVNLDKVQSKPSHGTVQSKLQETDILRQLRHPNILPYVDAFITPHSLYTFTELASGGDLMSFIYRHDVIKEFDARILIRQIVRGLRYLHVKGIVHRDLKPENILLAYSPKLAYQRVMLSDFGNSAVLRRNRMMTNVGTSAYQAPEFQSRGQAQTSAVDIWSLGVVVLLLLASSLNLSLDGLNHMDQKELGKFLQGVFSKLDKEPSSNAKDFIWSCLQTTPSLRITALEGECHDWLCRPEKHMAFFRELDRRIIREWESERELRPIPWELPDVARGSPPCKEPRSEHHASGQFAANEYGPAVSDTSSSPERSRESEVDLVPAEAESPIVGLVAESPENHAEEEPRKAEDAAKQSQPPWTGFAMPIGFATPKPRHKRKRSSRIRFPDNSLLPLPSLDRHLRPAPNNRRREQVLAELKKTNSKFLVGNSPIVPMTPPRPNLPQRAPSSPKKHRTTGNALVAPANNKAGCAGLIKFR